MTTVFHIMPPWVYANTYHGTYKDVVSRTRFLERASVDYRQLLVGDDCPGQVLSAVRDHVDCRFLVEYSFYPRVVKSLRLERPDAFIAVRSINLEPMQHFDNHGWWSKKGPLWTAYGMARLLANDVMIKRHASAIWSINEWEKRVYWDRLPGTAEVEWMPYFCPEHLLPDRPPASVERRAIVCLPTSQKNRKSWDLVIRFIKFAEEMQVSSQGEYEFLLTGDLSGWNLPSSSAVTYTGLVDDIRQLLQSAKAVAMLSGLGYGFKTTIGDAIANGAAVLAHPRLVRRCPQQIADMLIPLDVDSRAQIVEATVKLHAYSPNPSVDNHQKKAAEQLLSQLLMEDAAAHSGMRS